VYITNKYKHIYVCLYFYVPVLSVSYVLVASILQCSLYRCLQRFVYMCHPVVLPKFWECAKNAHIFFSTETTQMWWCWCHRWWTPSDIRNKSSFSACNKGNTSLLCSGTLIKCKFGHPAGSAVTMGHCLQCLEISCVYFGGGFRLSAVDLAKLHWIPIFRQVDLTY